MKYIFPFAFFLIAVSCSERTDIDVDTQPAKLVINTFISTEPSQQAVWLSKTVPYFGSTSIPAVTSAQVWINGVQFVECDTVPGKYLSPDNNFYAASEQQCSLRVLYDLDGDGMAEEFTANETMTHDVMLDTLVAIAFRQDTGRYIPPFFVNAKFRRSMLDDNFTSDMYYGGQNMCRSLSNYGFDNIPYGTYGEVCTFTLSTGGTALDLGYGDTLYLCPFDTIHVRISSIPKSTLSYLRSAETESGGSNPMFGGPPANVTFNIEGKGGIGCFALCNTSSWKSLVLPMNVKTLEAKEWTATDGSGQKISISADGTAKYTNGASRGQVYFANVRVDAAIRGFWAKKPNSLILSEFKMISYDEFVDVNTMQGWKREEQGFFD